jgi:hypothetical protein
MLRRVVVLLASAALQCGCAEQLHLLHRGPTGGVSPCSFWPPPPGSATWVADTSATAQGEALSSVARELDLSLQSGGYTEQHWYPIGTGSRHGFAVTTRLERVENEHGAVPSERWSALYPDAANLRWLVQARRPGLPSPGRYRVFLVSYTDLPIGRTNTAPTWNEETVMDWPGAIPSSTSSESGIPQRTAVGYRFGVYEYVYEWDEVERRGRLLQADLASSGARQAPPFALPLTPGVAP